MTGQETQRRGLSHIVNELEAENRRLAALVASIPAIKANVRDACSVACAETKAAYNRFDKVGEAQRIAAQACIDAVAALDLDVL